MNVVQDCWSYSPTYHLPDISQRVLIKLSSIVLFLLCDSPVTALYLYANERRHGLVVYALR